MRALVHTGPGDLAWQDLPDVAPPGHGALVRPLAVARCDLDSAMAAFGLFPGPYAVGHELVGEVVEVGADVDLAVGTRVSVPFQVSCGTCVACRAGRTVACTTYRAPAGAAYGFGERGGGHGGAVADALVVPHADHLLVPAPAAVGDVALATLPDNALDAYRAVAPHLAERPGADVLVLGGAAPSIGLYAVAWARTLGAGSVRYADHDAGRCADAERLGARVEILDAGWPRRFERAPVVVDTTADAQGLVCAIRSTEDAGVLSVLGIVFGEASVPLLEMYSRGLTLHTSRADSRHHLPAVLDLVATGVFDPLVVPVTTVSFDDAAEAWLQPATKLVLVRG
ncbi:zinc-dependent alcohol dehydrogenase [Nocardioides rubriscoriae]|uniref:zinc-dependent alcohol dehydrogenase n=1 Tax=Nocardioides rubriscoriae TaxID=642762 RepID=UPI0011DFB7E4|nr:alcohol dehydrogenase catalytic domain-containing protein [Nocardioides rubriscoriae]